MFGEDFIYRGGSKGGGVGVGVWYRRFWATPPSHKEIQNVRFVRANVPKPPLFFLRNPVSALEGNSKPSLQIIK